MMVAPNGLNVEREPVLNAERVERIKRLLSGDYKPQGLMDVYYDSELRS